MWTDVIHDDCTCKWINYSDHGGWYLKGRKPDCPVHGEADPDTDRARCPYCRRRFDNVNDHLTLNPCAQARASRV